MNEHCFFLASRIRNRCAPNSGTNMGLTCHQSRPHPSLLYLQLGASDLRDVTLMLSPSAAAVAANFMAGRTALLAPRQGNEERDANRMMRSAVSSPSSPTRDQIVA